jgi:demethylmenaquinone methyltransferase/2-methoxy-6-polyprenyl-1,4-benzoquinol methylase
MTRSTDSSQLGGLNLDQDLATQEGKRRYVRTLFDTVERSYDGFTRVFSVGMDGAWKRHMVRLLAESGLSQGRVLDLATGTGDIVDRLNARIPRVNIVGADLSRGMLRRANRRGSRTNAVADMSVLPYATGSMAAITAGYAFRNAPDLTAALEEAHRVLEPGGSMVTLDFYLPALPAWRRVYLGYLRITGRMVGRVLHGVPEAYGYIAASLERWMTADDFSASLERLGLKVTNTKRDGKACLHLAWKTRLSVGEELQHRPHVAVLFRLCWGRLH